MLSTSACRLLNHLHLLFSSCPCRLPPVMRDMMSDFFAELGGGEAGPGGELDLQDLHQARHLAPRIQVTAPAPHYCAYSVLAHGLRDQKGEEEASLSRGLARGTCMVKFKGPPA